MDEGPEQSRRSRRAVPLIAAALTTVVVAGLLYVRAFTPPPAGTPTSAAIPTMSGPYSVTYDLISPTVGWAIVLDYTRPEIANFWIFKTTDGAGHWGQQYQGTVEGGYSYIHFFDQLNGYAYAGARLYRTTDGGRSWGFVFTPASNYAGPLATFASPTVGWALDFGDGSPRLYSTTDGGHTWSGLPGHIPSDAVFERTRESTFTDSGEGCLGAGPDSSPVVYRTLDGGASWQPITVSSLKGNYSTTVRLLPGGGVLVLVSGEVGLQTAFMSVDGGASWQDVSLPPPVKNSEDLHIAGASHWWAFLSDGVLFTTANAGRTWQGISEQGLPKLWNFDSAGAIDSDHAWWSLVSPEHSTASALAMTSDGGAHWKMVNPPQPE